MDQTQFEHSELPDAWQENIKKSDYKADDYVINKSYKQKKLIDQKRKCTDVLCCLLFLVFLGAMFGFAIYGYINGEISTLLAPVDGDGRLCGVTTDVKDYPNLWIADITTAANNPTRMFNYGVCVKICPTGTNQIVQCVPTNAVHYCSRPSLSYGTDETMSYCLPNYDQLTENQKAGWDGMVNNFENSFFGSWAADVYKARWVILTSIGICVVLTLLYVVAMHCFAAILAWISVALIQLGLIALGVFFFYQRKDLLAAGQDNASTSALFWGMLLSWIAAGIFYLFLACNFKSLSVSIAIIKVTSDWVADTKRILFMPLCFFVFGMCLFALWMTGLACVASISEEPIVSAGPGDQAKVLKWSGLTYFMIYTMVFFAIWMTCFLTSFNEYVTIVAAISWYFSDKTIYDSDGIPGDSEVILGFKWGIFYQFGSIAFGSLILAVVWIVHSILAFVAKRMENASGENPCVKCMIGCCMCIVNCFDRFIRYITQNAYIYMALSNESFCIASVHAFLLMLKNAAKFSMVSGISTVFMFIAKVCISVTTTWLGFLLMGAMIPKGESFSEPLVPVLLILFMAYLIASIFIGVFDAGANTILQCYLMDKEMGGHDDEPHVPKNLKRFLEHDSSHDEQKAPLLDSDQGANNMA